MSLSKNISFNLRIDGVLIHVERKNVKNLNLRVYPSDGSVKITAPTRTSMSVIQEFALAKIEWIKKKRSKSSQHQKKVYSYAHEGHLSFWGLDYQIMIHKSASTQSVHIAKSHIIHTVRRSDSPEKNERRFKQWLKAEFMKKTDALVLLWKERLGVEPSRVTARTMLSRWGSCSVGSRSIRINLALVHLPPHYLEYIVVHELCHLLEASHNKRYYALMDGFYPQWRSVRKELKQISLRTIA